MSAEPYMTPDNDNVNDNIPPEPIIDSTILNHPLKFAYSNKGVQPDDEDEGHKTAFKYAHPKYECTVGKLVTKFYTIHRVSLLKDGLHILQGSFIGERRGKRLMEQLCMMQLDLDAGDDFDEVVAKAKASGYFTIAYDTFSSGGTVTSVSKKTVDAMAGVAEGQDATLEQIRTYLREVKRTREHILTSATFGGVADDGKGGRYILNHKPMNKMRLVFILDKSLNVAANGGWEKVTKFWEGKRLGLEKFYDVTSDGSTEDLGRVFYTPCHAPGKVGFQRIEIINGRLLPLDEIESVALANFVDRYLGVGRDRKEYTSSGDEFKTEGLLKFLAQYNHRFRFQTFIEDINPNGERYNGNWECPFEDEHDHEKAGFDKGFFGLNPDDSKTGNFVAYCPHDTCLKANHRTPAHYLDALCQQYDLTVDDLIENRNWIWLEAGENETDGPQPKPWAGGPVDTGAAFSDLRKMFVEDGIVPPAPAATKPTPKSVVRTHAEIMTMAKELREDSDFNAFIRAVAVCGFTKNDEDRIQPVVAKYIKPRTFQQDVKAAKEAIKTAAKEAAIAAKGEVVKVSAPHQSFYHKEVPEHELHDPVTKSWVGVFKQFEARAYEFCEASSTEEMEEFFGEVALSNKMTSNEKRAISRIVARQHVGPDRDPSIIRKLYTDTAWGVWHGKRPTDNSDIDAIMKYMDKYRGVRWDGSFAYVDATRVRPILLSGLKQEFWNTHIGITDDKGEKHKLPNWFDQYELLEKRKIYSDVTFDPTNKNASTVFNMWRGRGLDSEKGGDWSILREHIFTNVCNSNPWLFAYFICTIALWVQFPAERAGVGILIKGLQGTGKSKVTEWICQLWPDHSMDITDEEQLFGRFNEAVARCVVLNCAEAIFIGNAKYRSKLKAMHTNLTINVEPKGRAIKTQPSMLHMLYTSNEDRAIPATPEERRFFALEIGIGKMKDVPYFRGLDRAMNNGGLEGFLWDMEHLKLPSYFEAQNPPITAAFLNQVKANFEPWQKWLYDCLVLGEIICTDTTRDGENESVSHRWPSIDDPASEPLASGTVRVTTVGPPCVLTQADIDKEHAQRDSWGLLVRREAVLLSCNQSHKIEHSYKETTFATLGAALKKQFGDKFEAFNLGGTNYYHFPSLDECRKAFTKDNKVGFGDMYEATPPKEFTEEVALEWQEWGKNTSGLSLIK